MIKTFYGNDYQVAQVLAGLPTVVKTALKSGYPVAVAGGYVRDRLNAERAKDIDLFVPDMETAAKVQDLLEWEVPGAITKKNKNSVTITSSEALSDPPIQIITRFFVWPPQELIKTFDFTICQAALYYQNEHTGYVVVVTEEFLRDLENKAAEYTSPVRDEDAGSSVLRMVKLARKGYEISEDSIARCVGRFAYNLAANVTTPDFLTEDDYYYQAQTAFKRVAY